MSSGQWGSMPAPELQPPTDVHDFEPPRSSWPTVIGVIGIIFGSLGLFCGCLGYFAVPLQRWGIDMQAKGGQVSPVSEVQLRVAEQYQIIMYVMVTIGLLSSIWLLVGSINLLRRRRSSRSNLIGWALASVLLTLVNVGFQAFSMMQTIKILNAEGHSDRVGEAYFGIAVAGCMAIVFGLGWPVFVLIWMARSKIKAEVALWSELNTRI